MRFLRHLGPGAARPAARLLSDWRVFPLLPCTLVLLLSGCAGTVSQKNTQTPPPNTYAISGSITPASAGSGASLSLSGPSTANTTADSSGNFSFSGLANGTYVLTPSRSGYTFTPANQSVTVNGANATGISFTAAQQAAHSATLSWTASTSTVSGYNIYRGTSSGGPYTKMNSSLVTVLTYVDSNVTGGNTYYYVSTSVDTSGNESAYSNQATAKIP